MTLSDLQMQSPDLNRERLETLKQLFPDLFTLEGQLNPDELRKLVDPASVSETERYEFRWFGKSQAKRAAFTPTDTTLIFDAVRSINAAAQNLIIEGENLEVLKLLVGAYREKVKCIYIDPPYNTGNDFVYNDDFSQNKRDYLKDAGYVENGIKLDTNAESDGRFHSNWLDMLYPRLLVARALLYPDGVIFVSIDDHEVHHLRKLMDEVFGEENLVTQIVWQSRQSIQNDTDISVNHEYILVYAKNRRQTDRRLKESNADRWYTLPEFAMYPLPLDKDKFANPDNDPRGLWKADPFDAPNVRQNLTYKIVNPNTGEEYWPPTGRCWRTEEENYNKLLADGRILFGKFGETRPQLKVFYEEKKDFGEVENTWFNGDTHGTATHGTKELQEIFGTSIFESPKPTTLIKSLLTLSTHNDNLVLDFFAGSGTMGQAVMELNEADGGNRQFILAQLPEATDEKSEARKAGYKKISDITIERCKRVVARMEAARQTVQPNLLNDVKPQQALGFKVFRLAPSNFPRTEWTPDSAKSDEENVASLRAYIAAKENSLQTAFVRDEMLQEILLKKEGFSLNATWQPDNTFTANAVWVASDPANDKRVRVCLDDSIEPETLEQLKTHKDLKFVCLDRALDTTRKWNLEHYLGDKFKAY